MARRDRSRSPDTSNKRVRSHRSPRSPSPTRRQRASNRYDDVKDVKSSGDSNVWDIKDRDRARDRDRERQREERHREERRKEQIREERERRERAREDRERERRRSRSRERTAAATPGQPASATGTPPVEDDKVKARRDKLEAWRKARDASKALDEAKAKAMALAGKVAPPTATGTCIQLLVIFKISHHLIIFSSVLVRFCSKTSQSLCPKRHRLEGPTSQNGTCKTTQDGRSHG